MAVQLRGVSTHGLTWFPDYINESLFSQISDDWSCNLIRLAMYSETYCKGEREENLELLRKGIDFAVKADMYVIVDWHILNDYDPNQNIEYAKEFFDTIAEEYADCPNVIFEICNEPNGETGWSDVMAYSEIIIPIIRKHIPDSVILVGTPEYDRNLGDSILRPLHFDNVMYVLHFYTATHHENLFSELESAVDAGLPVFISECGISESSGDGDIDFEYVNKWFSYLSEHKISYAVWNLSDKDESSAFFRTGFDPYGEIMDDNLTVTGKWVRELIRGASPYSIPAPAAVVHKSSLSEIEKWITDSLGERRYEAVSAWTAFAAAGGGIVILFAAVQLLFSIAKRKKKRTYDDIAGTDIKQSKKAFRSYLRGLFSF